MSTKDVGAAVVGSFQRIGSAISEKLSRVGTGGRSFVVRTPSFVATKGASPQQNQQEQYSPEPPKLPQIQYQSKVQQPEHIAKPKQTQKEKEDEERNSRHADVVGFLNGTKTLSAEFTENYKLGEVLGDGAFGFVMTATSLKDGKEVAVKFITRDKIPRDLWVKDPSNTNEKIPVEIAILQQISHPNIIKYIAHVVEPTKYILLITELHGTEWVSPPVQQPEDVDKAGSSTNIVAEKKRASSAGNAPPPTSTPLPKMECSPLFRLTPEQEKQIRRRTSCDLFECIDKRIPEPLAKKIFAQIALAVHFLHTNDLVHRDLKDENIVIDADYNIKLIDFGSAAHIPTQPKDYFTKFNGTTHFASPEIANHLAYRGPEAEMWYVSLGVLLYTIVFGENPFHNLTDILRGEYRIPFGLESDVQIEGCRHLIKRLLAYNPKERIKIDEVRQRASVFQLF
ncbi:kinase-like domain-containing protein [Obelidium mucronatum]|nr:kinase-like domain-containing protein [Obelidium mucronatum]